MSDENKVEETEFLTNYNPHEYPNNAYTADIIVLTIRNGKLSVLLVRRANPPFKDSYALPGGFVEVFESSEEAAARELLEETNITLDQAHMEQLKTYSTPGRDPRMRVITTAYLAFIPNLPNPVGGDDAKEAHFFAIEELAAFNPDNEEGITLAFDHETILRDALERAAAKLEYSPLATAFLDEDFTIPELRRVYEAVWGFPLHASNFRRKVLSTPDFVIPLGTVGKNTEEGRVTQLYKTGQAPILHPALLRANNR